MFKRFSRRPDQKDEDWKPNEKSRQMNRDNSNDNNDSSADNNDNSADNMNTNSKSNYPISNTADNKNTDTNKEQYHLQPQEHL